MAGIRLHSPRPTDHRGLTARGRKDPPRIPRLTPTAPEPETAGLRQLVPKTDCSASTSVKALQLRIIVVTRISRRGGPRLLETLRGVAPAAMAPAQPSRGAVSPLLPPVAMTLQRLCALDPQR